MEYAYYEKAIRESLTELSDKIQSLLNEEVKKGSFIAGNIIYDSVGPSGRQIFRVEVTPAYPLRVLETTATWIR